MMLDRLGEVGLLIVGIIVCVVFILILDSFDNPFEWEDINFNDVQANEYVMNGGQYQATFILTNATAAEGYTFVVGILDGGEWEGQPIIGVVLGYPGVEIDHVYRARGTFAPGPDMNQWFYIFELEDLGERKSTEGVVPGGLFRNIIPSPTRDGRFDTDGPSLQHI